MALETWDSLFSSSVEPSSYICREPLQFCVGKGGYSLVWLAVLGYDLTPKEWPFCGLVGGPGWSWSGVTPPGSGSRCSPAQLSPLLLSSQHSRALYPFTWRWKFSLGFEEHLCEHLGLPLWVPSPESPFLFPAFLATLNSGFWLINSRPADL